MPFMSCAEPLADNLAASLFIDLNSLKLDSYLNKFKLALPAWVVSAWQLKASKPATTPDKKFILCVNCFFMIISF